MEQESGIVIPTVEEVLSVDLENEEIYNLLLIICSQENFQPYYSLGLTLLSKMDHKLEPHPILLQILTDTSYERHSRLNFLSLYPSTRYDELVEAIIHEFPDESSLLQYLETVYDLFGHRPDRCLLERIINDLENPKTKIQGEALGPLYDSFKLMLSQHREPAPFPSYLKPFPSALEESKLPESTLEEENLRSLFEGQLLFPKNLSSLEGLVSSDFQSKSDKELREELIESIFRPLIASGHKADEIEFENDDSEDLPTGPEDFANLRRRIARQILHLERFEMERLAYNQKLISSSGDSILASLRLSPVHLQWLGPANPEPDFDLEDLFETTLLPEGGQEKVTPNLNKIYGGPRMFIDTQSEYDQQTDSMKDEWFTGSCDICLRKIRHLTHAVRRPLIFGGWEGCYCTWDCVRVRIEEEYPRLDQLEKCTETCENLVCPHVSAEDLHICRKDCPEECKDRLDSYAKILGTEKFQRIQNELELTDLYEDFIKREGIYSPLLPSTENKESTISAKEVTELLQLVDLPTQVVRSGTSKYSFMNPIESIKYAGDD